MIHTISNANHTFSRRAPRAKLLQAIADHLTDCYGAKARREIIKDSNRPGSTIPMQCHKCIDGSGLFTALGGMRIPYW